MLKFEEILFDDMSPSNTPIREHLLSVFAENNLLTLSELEKLNRLAQKQDVEDQEQLKSKLRHMLLTYSQPI